jgi:hypothetical protein
MAPKSRRKKKYVGQRSPQAVAAGVSRVAKPVNRPAPAGAVSARPVPAGPRVQAQMAPSLSAANVGKEIRTIAVLAGVLLLALVVISVVLA